MKKINIGRPIQPNNVLIKDEIAMIACHCKGRVVYVTIDTEDLALVGRFKWSVVANNRGLSLSYAKTEGVTNGKRWGMFMHRLLCGDAGIDHRDGNGLNNRRSNLRTASRSQNNANTRPHRGKQCAFKGVRRRLDGRYDARIQVDGKSLSLGSRLTPEDAARLYDNGAIQHFGEFAKTNAMLGLL